MIEIRFHGRGGQGTVVASKVLADALAKEGNFEYSAWLAKKALLRRPLGSHNTDPFYADMERRLLERINKLGIGPQGMGGRITALAVHVESYPCHIASMPAAVNIQCHSHRVLGFEL